MKSGRLSRSTLNMIDAAVKDYEPRFGEFERFAQTIVANLYWNGAMNNVVHSSKYRAKDPSHLRSKLFRIAVEAKTNNRKFDISAGNLYESINDLAGIRLLHLHTKQMSRIHEIIMEALKEHNTPLICSPVAYTWDIESADYFKSLGIEPVNQQSMYTSVHYVIQANRQSHLRCEIQVRTLMEEVFGEVSHTINYPEPSTNIACVEQLRVLARFASGCTRLVDSIFLSHNAHAASKTDAKRKRPRH